VGQDARGDHHRQHVHSYQQHRAHRESDEQALSNQSMKQSVFRIRKSLKFFLDIQDKDWDS
jgi:hypothetical protein